MHRNRVGALNSVTRGAPSAVVTPGVTVLEGGNLVGIGFPGREAVAECELPPHAPSRTATAQAANHREDLTNQPSFLPTSPSFERPVSVCPQVDKLTMKIVRRLHRWLD
jgi:hypothetical protein